MNDRRNDPRDGEPSPARRHPHFDDRGAHEWTEDWADAAGRARAAGKLVFVEVGREL